MKTLAQPTKTLKKHADCVILARVSSKAQEEEGFSLEAQEKLLKSYCERTDLKVRKMFKIAEKASKSDQRKVFEEMMAYVNRHDIKNIVVEKVDRFVRNLKDTVMADDWLEADEVRKLHCIKDSLVLHKNSRSQEKLNWGIRVVIAKNYIDNLREEVDKGQQEKLAQGWLPGTPPLGYKNIGEVKRKLQALDEAVAPLVRVMFELYDTGFYSLSTLTAEMKERGLRSRNDRPLSKSHIYKMLLNPYYVGRLFWKGVEHPNAQHQPLISTELFESVQTRLKRPNAPKYNKHNPLLKGMVACDNCGKLITWERQRGKWYGSCNTKDCPREHYAKQDEVENDLAAYFEALLCPEPELVDWIKVALQSSHKDEITVHNSSVTQLNRRYDMLQTKLDNLYEDRLEGRISVEYYDTKFKDITEERDTVVQSLDRLTHSNTDYIEKGVEVLELTQRAAEIYQSKNETERRALLGDIFSNIGLNGQLLVCEYKKEAAAVLDKVEQTKALEATFEHDDNGLVKDKEAFLEASRSIWLVWVNSNFLWMSRE